MSLDLRVLLALSLSAHFVDARSSREPNIVGNITY